MDWWLLTFFLGAILSLFLPIVPVLSQLILILTLALLFLYFKSLRSSSGLWFGSIWMLFNALLLNNILFDNYLESTNFFKKKHSIEGVVVSLQSKIDEGTSLKFNMKVTHIDQKALNKPFLVRLNWSKAEFSPLQGQTILLNAKLKPAHGLSNLGGFSYKAWLNSKKIAATGYVVNNKKFNVLKNNRVIKSGISPRQKLFLQYKALLPKHHLSALLLALSFGDRSDLSPDLWHVLQATGTGHLIAISGLHIGLVATGGFTFILLLIRYIPLFNISKIFIRKKGSLISLQSFNFRYIAIFTSILMALSYGYLAGFSLPTSRALVMLCLYWFSRLFTIKLSIKRWFLLTLFILVIITPFSLFTASFWLSVYAVSIIFITLWRFKYFLQQGTKLKRFIKGLILVQFSLTIMLLPITVLFFQQFSLVAFFANLLAVPWMSFVTIPLCLLSVLCMPISEYLAQILMSLSLSSLTFIWHWFEFLIQQPWVIINVSILQVKLFILFGLLLGSVLFLSPNIKNLYLKINRFKLRVFNINKLFALKVITVAISVFILVTNFPFIYSKRSDVKLTENKSLWELVVFDVGQGLSILISRNGRSILYDTGASYPSGFNMIDAVVLPYLQYSGVDFLDKVIISHRDNDHAGGLSLLKNKIKIKQLYINTPVNNIGDTVVNICLQGHSFLWQKLTFKMLWPDKAEGENNDDSCVVLISDGNKQVLLSGDISKKVEAKLLMLYPDLKADILIVPHHGSKTSSSNKFLSALSPQIAIVSAGFLNRWNMPVSSVVKLYREQNIPLLNTADTGQIILIIDDDKIKTQTYIDNLWPFWFLK